MSKVYLKLTTGKQEDLNLIDVKSINLNKNNINLKLKENFRIPRDKLMNLSDDEKNKHENFLSEMKDSMWKKII